MIQLILARQSIVPKTIFTRPSRQNGLRMFFASDRSGNYDIWMSTRDTLNDPWNDPIQLDDNVNHPDYIDVSPTLSPDGSTLYLSANRSPSPYVLSWDIFAVPILTSVLGDFNEDGALTVTDIDALAEAIRDGSSVQRFDLNGDNQIDSGDYVQWIDLANTWVGDANLDGEFNSGDLVDVFQSGHYEDDLPKNSGWGDGDWNGDAEFDSGDFVVAFQDSGFERGPRNVSSVPEPSVAVMMAIGFIGLFRTRSPQIR